MASDTKKLILDVAERFARVVDHVHLRLDPGWVESEVDEARLGHLNRSDDTVGRYEGQEALGDLERGLAGDLGQAQGEAVGEIAMLGVE